MPSPPNVLKPFIGSLYWRCRRVRQIFLTCWDFCSSWDVHIFHKRLEWLRKTWRKLLNSSVFFFVVLASSWICGLICGGEQGFGFENKPVGAFSGFDFGCFCILLTTCKSSTADQMNKRTVLISRRFYKASSHSLMLIKDVYYVPKSCIAASLNSDIWVTH